MWLTYQSSNLTSPLKLSKEGRLQLAVCMIVGLEGLQNLIEALEQECPEVMEGAKVTCKSANMSRIMMVWFECTRSIKLDDARLMSTIAKYMKLTCISSPQYCEISRSA